MIGYSLFPLHEAGYDFAASHPAIDTWLGQIKGLPDWRAPYDLLPGQRMLYYVDPND